ncbi:MAG: PH domain-containing protein [Lachnospiraceae bacterium]
MEEKNEIIGLHNHFSIILENAWAGLIVLVGLFIGNFDLDEIHSTLDTAEGMTSLWFVLLFFAALFCFYLLFHILRWRKTTITIQNGTIVLERRTMNRLTNTISVSDISNVNLEQNLLERLFHTYKLKIDTNTSSTAEECDIKIVLKKDTAYAVKQLIFQMMQGQSSDFAESDSQAETAVFPKEENEHFDIVYSTREILRNTALSVNIFAILLVWGISLLCFEDFILNEKKPLLLRIGVVLLTLFCSLQQVFSSWNLSYGFRCRREKDQIFIRTGFLKKKQYTIPLKKINALQVHYTFFGRLCNCPSLKVINIGGEDEETSGTQLLLAAPYARLKRQLQILLPEAQIPEPEHLIHQPRRVMVKNELSVLFQTLLASGIFVWIRMRFFPQLPLLVLYLFAVLGFYRMLTTICKNITAGFALTPHALISEEGCFSKKLLFIPYTRIQNLCFHHGPIEGLLGVEKLDVHILADLLNSTIVLSAFPKKDVEKLKNYFRETY